MATSVQVTITAEVATEEQQNADVGVLSKVNEIPKAKGKAKSQGGERPTRSNAATCSAQLRQAI